MSTHRLAGSSCSRRSLLATAGSIGLVASAGCLGDLLSFQSGPESIQPTDPGDSPQGTPAEFYHFLEENGITVESLHRNEDDELVLIYTSDAETVEESEDEMVVIYQVFYQGLYQRGSSVEFLYAEIDNPFDEQALGWGIDANWLELYAEGQMDVEALWFNIANSRVYQEDIDNLDNESTTDEDDLEETDTEISNESSE